MGFRASVYRVMIISPNDVPEERDIIERAIVDWNDEHAEAQGVVFISARWERSSPRQGAAGQDVLNEDLVDISDAGIAVFWQKLGTPTRNSDSGAVEEIERFAAGGKRHCILFKSPTASPPDPKQYEALQAFKKGVHAHKGALVGLTKSFADEGSLRDIVKRFLTDSLQFLPHVIGEAGLTRDQQHLLSAIANRVFATESPFVNTKELDDDAVTLFSAGRLQSGLSALQRGELIEIKHDLGELGIDATITEEGMLLGTRDLAEKERRIRGAICAQWKTTSAEIAERLELPELLVIAVARRLKNQGLVNMLRGTGPAKIHRPTSELCNWEATRPRKACLVLGHRFSSKDSHGRQAVEVSIINEGEFEARDVRVFWDVGEGFPSAENYPPLFEEIPARMPGPSRRYEASFALPYPDRDEHSTPVPMPDREVRLKLTYRDGSGEPGESLFTLQVQNRSDPKRWTAEELKHEAQLSPLCMFARPEAQR